MSDGPVTAAAYPMRVQRFVSGAKVEGLLASSLRAPTASQRQGGEEQGGCGRRGDDKGKRRCRALAKLARAHLLT